MKIKKGQLIKLIKEQKQIKKKNIISEQYVVARRRELQQMIKKISGASGTNFVNLFGAIMKLIMISFNHEITFSEGVKIHKALNQIFPGSMDYTIDYETFTRNSKIADNEK